MTTTQPSKGTVLITGGSGFIGGHVIIAALTSGYTVRTTVRNTSRAASVRQTLQNGGISPELASQVQFFPVDLTSDDGWADAVAGCDYVLHVASPFPATEPKTEDELIVPAREGTLRALRFAKKAGTVKRVVITSSVASVAYGYAGGERTVEEPFTEKDWTVLEGSRSYVGVYMKSKTLAERAAWEWVEREGDGLELATVNPVAVFGPVLGKDSSTSVSLVQRMVKGLMPGVPQICTNVVDVRDVATLHVLAMSEAKAAGQRYLAVSDEKIFTAKDMALALKRDLPKKDSWKVMTHELPNFLVRLAGKFDQSAGFIVPELGMLRPISNEKAKTELGWKPRSAAEAVVASAESLKKHGMA